MDINFGLIWDALPLLLAGAGITIEITALSVGFGLLIGMTVGIARLASIKPVRYFANCYVDFIRGTPLLVQIFWFISLCRELLGTAWIPILQQFLPVLSIVVLILRKFSVPVSNQLIMVKWKLAVL